MVVFLLLLIVAILLFGSSAVIGVLGKVLAALLAIAALVWATFTLSISLELLALSVVGILAAFAGTNYLLEQMKKSEATTEPTPSTPSESSSALYRKYGAEIEANRKFRESWRSDT